MNKLDIERLAEQYSLKEADVRDQLMALQAAVSELTREALPGVRKAVRPMMTAREKLFQAVEAHPELFKKPKTLTAHGVKVGYRKLKGKAVIKDESGTIKLINRHFPEKADLLINTKESVNKDALNQLDVRQLKKIGVAVESDSDDVVLKSIEADLDKLVNTIVGDDINSLLEQQ